MAEKTIVTASRGHDRFADLALNDLTDAEIDSVTRLALAAMKRRVRRGKALDSPMAASDLLQLKYADAHAEMFGVVYLDTRHRVISVVELFQGTIDGSAVHPRIVVQRALSLNVNAAACILWHNHPSGVAEPSAADERITRRIKDALALVDIRVLDHIVIGSEGTVSMAERGLL